MLTTGGLPIGMLPSAKCHPQGSAHSFLNVLEDEKTQVSRTDGMRHCQHASALAPARRRTPGARLAAPALRCAARDIALALRVAAKALQGVVRVHEACVPGTGANKPVRLHGGRHDCRS